MPSKFGGQSVNAPASGSRFGGVPIATASAPKLDRASAEAMLAQVEQAEGASFAPADRERFIADAMTHGADIARRPEPKNPGTIPGADDPAEHGMPGVNLHAAGVGKTLRDTGLGATQWAGEVVNAITGNPDLQQWAGDRIAVNQAADQDLMRTTGGKIGSFTGQVAQMAAPGTATARAGAALPAMTRAALESGVFSALQPVQEGGNRVANAGMGAALGAVGQKVAQGLGTLARGASDKITPEMVALLAKAKQAGIRVGLPELLQNPALRTMLDQMRRLPLSGGRAAEEANRKAFNRAVSQTFGENAEAITPAVYEAAKKRLGQEFERLSANATLPISPQMLAQLGRTRSEAERLAVGDTGRVVNNWITDLLSKAQNGVIPGKAYQSFDSKIGEAMKSGGESAVYLGRVRDAVRQAMDAAAPAGDKAARDLARRQYAALKTVRDLVAKESGEGISPQALLARVTSTQAGKERAARGAAGELGQLARVGQRFLRASPNSGTADRAVVNATVLGALGGTAPFSPGTALGGLGMLLGNRAAVKVANSTPVVNYVTRGLPAPAQRAIAQGSKPLPYAAATQSPPVLSWLQQMLDDSRDEAAGRKRR